MESSTIESGLKPVDVNTVDQKTKKSVSFATTDTIHNFDVENITYYSADPDIRKLEKELGQLPVVKRDKSLGKRREILITLGNFYDNKGGKAQEDIEKFFKTKALGLFENASRTTKINTPECASCAFRIGQVYVDLGKYLHAKEKFEQVLAMNQPEHSDSAKLHIREIDELLRKNK